MFLSNDTRHFISNYSDFGTMLLFLNVKFIDLLLIRKSDTPTLHAVLDRSMLKIGHFKINKVR